MARYSDYSFVVDSSFTPFSMQELLTPMMMYKDAYEKSEEAYSELTDKADKFKYLSKSLPEGSRSRQIYEGYANELNRQAEDLAHNGLTMGNRRALTNLKRRYQGEIGRLATADEALSKERELRRAMGAKDSSMLYAVDNLNIDDFLDGASPNLYNISGTDLYTKAAAASQAMSKRQFSVNGESKTLGGYYYDYIQRMGYTPEQLRQFGDQISADFATQVSVLPEFQQAANQILEANGVTENFKNNPSALRKAQQQVIRGLIDGAVYSEQHNPQRDLGRLTKSEQTSFDLQREQMVKNAAINGLTWNDQTQSYVYDIRRDPSHADELWKYDIDEETGQIKGYSDTYKQAVKEGLIPGKNIKMGADGKPVISTQKDNRKPKANMYFTKSGAKTVTLKNERNTGKQVSYEDAVLKYPEIGLYVNQDSDLYDYWDDGTGILLIGHPAQLQNPSSQQEETAIESSEGNQFFD